MLNPLGNPIGIVSDINENRLLPHIVNISFTLHQAGKYKIHIRVDGNEISNSPFQKEFLAGPADPQQSTIGIASSIIVVTRDVVHSLQLDCRDKFGNYCKAMENRFDLKLTKIGNPSALTNTELALSEQKLETKVIGEEGAYKAQLLYDSVILKNGDFTLVVLSNVDGAKLHKEIGRKKMNVTFEAKLASKENSYLDFSKKPKKVHCSISARQIKVREYYLKVFSNNVCSFRVLPSTKTLVIDDGIQAPLSVVCKEKYLFLATYATFLNRKFVGGDTFAMKMSYFQQELAALNIKRSQSKYAVSISRQHALRDSMKQLKNASASDWCRPFQIKFQGEQAEDLGGVLREWFHVLSRALFAPSNQLFVGFRDDNQALVRPNNARPPEFAKIKYFEFAGKIVGKCLLESAITRDSNCYIRACFARSFLAQILGLRVHYKHFENDDPEFFTNKIQYILSNDIADLSLVFAEEIYSSDGKLEKIIELKPNGKNCVVNNDNKIEYLDLLAQQRLCKEIQEEKNAFLKGLNDLIPDSLLSIFDENELELLICGTCEYDINDLKLNHAVIGRTSEFEKILSWFWSTIANFTQQEMARLLQFVTGCSQLPPEGFSELSPKFQIVNAMVTGTLPTAHTCFNELCLPIYDSLDDMQHSLLIAINEGSEGFGMS
ncbi:uncharacterized protein TRIADDRAFT_18936 [Trichoplax adhaerens]|uniref:HECT-type E3 ubiquitin transferase n=1 Tax=Trichoplax adhaerens TaxID=10228 RepID=B3RKL8_TRIAD|nr:hypothetical protein TRIADDRAFT_18936 [Trichoplax adhaerens]EDV29915.1 hypothetical protein TRIADDRAFT_18936 [Trichoplax adhaerens]|eukprot:XP_002109117.1 hypothetical protein TRIADDRAFT_18936 [Trichoplax adhaerens]